MTMLEDTTDADAVGTPLERGVGPCQHKRQMVAQRADCTAWHFYCADCQRRGKKARTRLAAEKNWHRELRADAGPAPATLWVVEAQDDGRWVPTEFVGKTRERAREQMSDWQHDGNCQRLRVSRYVAEARPNFVLTGAPR